MNAPVLICVGCVLFLATRKTKRKRKRLAIVEVKRAQPRHGLELKSDSVRVVDWNAWMIFAPDAIIDAIRQGASGPNEILSHIMQQIYPALRWPPTEDSPYAPQWGELVATIDRCLPRVAPGGKPNLRII